MSLEATAPREAPHSEIGRKQTFSSNKAGGWTTETRVNFEIVKFSHACESAKSSRYNFEATFMTKEMSTTKIAIFRKKEIRKTIHNREWFFVVEDVVLALTDSNDPKQYIQRMKLRDEALAKGWVQIVHTLPVKTAGGSQKMICANTNNKQKTRPHDETGFLFLTPNDYRVCNS